MAKSRTQPGQADSSAAPAAPAGESTDLNRMLLEGLSDGPDDSQDDVSSPESNLGAGVESPVVDSGSNVDAGGDGGEQAPVSIISVLSENGFEGIDEASAPARLGEFLTEQRERQQRIDHELAQLRSQNEYLRNQYLAQAQAQTAPQATPQPGATQQPTADAKWWNPPQVDQKLVQKYYDQESQGWKPGTPPEIIVQGEAWQAYMQDWQTKILYSPEDALRPIIEAYVRPLLESQIEERVSRQQQEASQQQFVQQFVQENPWIYRTDPMTGQIRYGDYSPDGLRLQQIATELYEDGLSEQAAWRHAKRLFEGEQAAKKLSTIGASTNGNPAQQAAQKRQEFLNRSNGATGIPDRGGSLPLRTAPVDKQVPQDRALSPGEQLLRQMQLDAAESIA